ncbi:MAG: glycine cleavage system aminomethyltransferase GcvT [Candidatus Margulisiibacteriota bacterium]
MNKTALYDTHVAMGGKMVPFGGYLLPVWFSDLKSEHVAVRQRVGMFDISHMGVLRIVGMGARAFLSHITCNNIDRAMDGKKMIYSMLLNDKGGILDDIMVGFLDPDFVMVVNAANKEKILQWFSDKTPSDVEIRDLTKSHGFIAVQGPAAVATLSATFDVDFAAIKRFGMAAMALDGIPVLAMRTGYTGEDGFELSIPNTHIQVIWKKVLDAGVTPCGLGARDTLRLEAGLPLYGHELSEDITPLQTRYAWAVRYDHDFVGKSALEAQKNQALPLVSVGIEMHDKMIARADYPILGGGRVTSGTLSPSLGRPIALAMVPPAQSPLGTPLMVEIRGKHYPATVVAVPFK